MYKVIFELIKCPLGLPISPLYEYVLLLIINRIAFQLAWDKSPGGKWGSTIHWVVRVPVFLVIWVITYFVIFVVKWLIANWFQAVCIIIGLVILSGLIIMFIKSRNISENEN